jgi:hypothetical protein
MPISDRRKWKIGKSPEEILKIVTEFLVRKKAKLIEANPSRIEATMGSGLKTRFFGGMFVSEQTLPVKATLSMKKVAKETEVDATIEDNMGFGSRMGMERKYRDYIEDLLDDLEDVL